MTAVTARSIPEYYGTEARFSFDDLTASLPQYGMDVGSETKTVSATLGRVTAAILPIAVSVLLSRLTPSRLHHFYTSGAGTRVFEALPVLDEWVYSPELVTAAQAHALSALLTVAYEDALGFDYIADDE